MWFEPEPSKNHSLIILQVRVDLCESWEESFPSVARGFIGDQQKKSPTIREKKKEDKRQIFPFNNKTYKTQDYRILHWVDRKRFFWNTVPQLLQSSLTMAYLVKERKKVAVRYRATLQLRKCLSINFTRCIATTWNKVWNERWSIKSSNMFQSCCVFIDILTKQVFSPFRIPPSTKDEKFVSKQCR